MLCLTDPVCPIFRLHPYCQIKTVCKVDHGICGSERDPVPTRLRVADKESCFAILKILNSHGPCFVGRVTKIGNRGPWAVFLYQFSLDTFHIVSEPRPDNDLALDFFQTVQQLTQAIVLDLHHLATVRLCVARKHLLHSQKLGHDIWRGHELVIFYVRQCVFFQIVINSCLIV